MDWIPQIFRRGKFYEDLSEEIRLHIEERTEQLMCDGMSREEAERTARMAFGNRTLLEERSREVWQWPTLESILSDVRFAMRQLRKSPGFTVAAVLTLALAIGANAVVFAVLNGVILRPLDVPHADSLYGLEHSDDHMGQESYPNYLDLRDRSRGFESLVAWNISQVGIDTGGDPSRAWVAAASGNYFDALGIQPFIGRTFHAGDERGLNSTPYIVLGYAYWHSHFQDDLSVLGRVIQVNKHPFTVIGVAPPGFRGTLLFFNPDFYVPIVNQPQVNSEFDLNTRGLNWIFETMGHLKPGVTPRQATADLNSVASYLGKT